VCEGRVKVAEYYMKASRLRTKERIQTI